MGKPRTYTDEQFVAAVKKCTSIRRILRELGLKEAGGNYRVAQQRIKTMGLDISHFKSGGWAKGLKLDYSNRAIPLIEILVESSRFQNSHKLKNKLLIAGIFERKCYNCCLVEWLGQPIALELEHKNGINNDNRIENLTLLCPNCHAQTPTYRGKNKKKKKIRGLVAELADAQDLSKIECLKRNL